MRGVLHHIQYIYFFTVSVVVGMECTSTPVCAELLANTVCLSSQCACDNGYTGTLCTGLLSPELQTQSVVQKRSNLQITTFFELKKVDNFYLSMC